MKAHIAFTPVAATRCQVSYASSAVRPSGFSQITCLPASAAAIVGSAWKLFGPELSKTPIRGSATSFFQSVTWSAKP